MDLKMTNNNISIITTNNNEIDDDYEEIDDLDRPRLLMWGLNKVQIFYFKVNLILSKNFFINFLEVVKHRLLNLFLKR